MNELITGIGEMMSNCTAPVLSKVNGPLFDHQLELLCNVSSNSAPSAGKIDTAVHRSEARFVSDEIYLLKDTPAVRYKAIIIAMILQEEWGICNIHA